MKIHTKILDKIFNSNPLYIQCDGVRSIVGCNKPIRRQEKVKL